MGYLQIVSKIYQYYNRGDDNDDDDEEEDADYETAIVRKISKRNLKKENFENYNQYTMSVKTWYIYILLSILGTLLLTQLNEATWNLIHIHVRLGRYSTSRTNCQCFENDKVTSFLLH